MRLIRTYRRYRRTGEKLASKLVEHSVPTQLLRKAARLLGLEENGRIVLDPEREGTVLIDFAIYDVKLDGKNAIAHYREEVGADNPDEEQMLDAWSNAYTSLFQIQDIDRDSSILYLKDALGSSPEANLLDESLSNSAFPGMFLFTRLVQMPEFYMTTGNSFAFLEAKEKQIQRRYKALMERTKSNDEDICRYVAFFKLSQTDGIDVAHT
jgi:hypothetical protein